MSDDVARLPIKSIGLAALLRTALTEEVGRLAGAVACVVSSAEAELSSAEATCMRWGGGSGIGALGSPADVESSVAGATAGAASALTVPAIAGLADDAASVLATLVVSVPDASAVVAAAGASAAFATDTPGSEGTFGRPTGS